MGTVTEIKTVMISGARLLAALNVLKLLSESSGGYQPSVWKRGARVVRERLGVNLDDAVILMHDLYDNPARVLHETLRTGGSAVGAINSDVSPFI